MNSAYRDCVRHRQVALSTAEADIRKRVAVIPGEQFVVLIEIAAVVVRQVADTAQAVFEVDDFVQFVAIQPETAVQHIATPTR